MKNDDGYLTDEELEQTKEYKLFKKLYLLNFLPPTFTIIQRYPIKPIGNDYFNTKEQLIELKLAIAKKVLNLTNESIECLIGCHECWNELPSSLFWAAGIRDDDPYYEQAYYLLDWPYSWPLEKIIGRENNILYFSLFLKIPNDCNNSRTNINDEMYVRERIENDFWHHSLDCYSVKLSAKNVFDFYYYRNFSSYYCNKMFYSKYHACDKDGFVLCYTMDWVMSYNDVILRCCEEMQKVSEDFQKISISGEFGTENYTIEYKMCNPFEWE